MIKILSALALTIIAATACTKQNATPTAPINETVDTTSAGTDLKYSGAFSKGAEGEIKGTANIYLQAGKYQLELKDFSVTNGPDLHVYLAKAIAATNFIDLGKLKSTSGNEVYAIAGMPDFMEYKYVLIYCQQYSALFGQTQLLP